MKRDLIKTIDKMINIIDIVSDDSVSYLTLNILLEELKGQIIVDSLDGIDEEQPWNEVANMLTYQMPDHRDPESPEWTREVAAIFVGKAYTVPVAEAA